MLSIYLYIYVYIHMYIHMYMYILIFHFCTPLRVLNEFISILELVVLFQHWEIFLTIKHLFGRNMQKEENLLYSLKQKGMQIDWHMPCQRTIDVRLCMVISHKAKGKEHLRAFEMGISTY